MKDEVGSGQGVFMSELFVFGCGSSYWREVEQCGRQFESRLIDLKHRVERCKAEEGRECSMSSRSFGT